LRFNGGNKVANNEGKEDKARGNTQERGLLLFWGNIFIAEKGKVKRGSFGD
jgi:hypothetical protein